MKILSRLLSALGFALLTVLLILGAKHLPTVFFSYYSPFSAKAMTALSNLSAFTSFSLWELILCALILWTVITLIRALCRGRFLRWASGLFLGLSVGVFLFVALWGLNYYAPSISQRMGLAEKQYTVEQLEEAARYYLDKANAAARSVDRDEDGFFLSAELAELGHEAGKSFVPLAEDYECFSGSKACVKTLLSSPLMAKTGTTGMFVCLTGESAASTLTYEVSMPYTMCHEAAHRLGFAREDEANFAAFLACSESDRVDFRYSGYYHAFLSCYNALYKVDPERARAVWSDVNQTLSDDIRRASAHYSALQSETASKVSDAVYDTYLKSFSVPEGVQSYGMAADLLLNWYHEVLK